MSRPVEALKRHVTSPAEHPFADYTAIVETRRSRLMRAIRVAAKPRGPYFATPAAAAAWGSWIYAEAALTDTSWVEPLSYGGGGVFIGLCTAVAAAKGAMRYPTAMYGGAVTSGTLLWSAWQVVAPSLPGAAIGVVSTVGASMPYWWWIARHRLDRDKLEQKNAKQAVIPDLVLAPDDVAGALAATGTPGATLERMMRHKDGSWTALVSLPVGVSPLDIASSAQRLARLQAALRLPPGWTLEVEDGGASHHLIVTARPPAPEQKIALPEYHPILDDLSVWDPWQPILVAVDLETGENVYLHLLARAGILIAGLQRMGKSVLLSVIVAHLALSGARLILADAKLVELSMWAALCQNDDDFVGRDPEAFLNKLLELQQEIDRRYARLVKEGRTKAEPGDGWEPIALIVDELAAYIDIPDRKLRGRIVSVLRDVLSRGPACEVPVVLATQKPEDKVVPSQIRDVCGQKVALATTTPEMTDTILGRGWAAKGAAAHLIGETEKGKAYVLEDGSRPRSVQTFPFEPPERRQVIEQVRKFFPDRPGARVLLPGTDDHDPDPKPPTPPHGGPGGGGRPRLRAVPKYPDGTRIPENRQPLWDALVKAGAEGLTKPQMVAAGLAGHGTSLQAPLSQWVAQGWVDDTGKSGQAKLYVLTATAHTPAPEVPATDKENATWSANL
ncbi:FtsK/SpoIIIE domain-containing protein [Streptomyces sp. NPDC005708]|uniref:FtsK/SpoIIIE domain-containing protein n=1 Tax=Streptomyces sp. NPDC005708 TaxID=3154564 RepID=UPI0033EE9B41